MLLLLVVSFISSCSVKKAATVIHYGTPKGPVKTIEQRNYSILPDNTTIEDRCCLEKYNFDKRGLKLKQEFLRGTALQFATVQSFYDNGLYNKIERHDSNGKITYREDFFLNNDGKYKSGNAYDGNGKLTRYFVIPVQNKFGQWTKLEWFSPDSVLLTKEEYKFKNELLIEQIWMNEKGIARSNRTYEHNEKGDEILIKLYAQVPGKDSTSLKMTKYQYISYDKYGNWTERTTLDKDNKPVKIAKRSITYW